MELKCVDLFAGIGAWELASSFVNSICQIKLETMFYCFARHNFDL